LFIFGRGTAYGHEPDGSLPFFAAKSLAGKAYKIFTALNSLLKNPLPLLQCFRKVKAALVLT
jgi:hypothetical protein